MLIVSMILVLSLVISNSIIEVHSNLDTKENEFYEELKIIK
jgi:hypothetical protein